MRMLQHQGTNAAQHSVVWRYDPGIWDPVAIRSSFTSSKSYWTSKSHRSQSDSQQSTVHLTWTSSKKVWFGLSTTSRSNLVHYAVTITELLYIYIYVILLYLIAQ